MNCGSTPVDERPTSSVENPANNANDRLQVHEVQGGFQGRILPETILIFCHITGSDVCEEDGFILKLMDLEGFGEVELNHALKFAKKGLLDEILRLIVVGVAVDEAFIL
jgi:hypothetical protein